MHQKFLIKFDAKRYCIFNVFDIKCYGVIFVFLLSHMHKTDSIYKTIISLGTKLVNLVIYLQICHLITRKYIVCIYG